MRIYVASSWRNEQQPAVVARLRGLGAEVYDFKNPAPGCNGFHWSEIQKSWREWTPEEFRKALGHPIASRGFLRDMQALDECDVCVLVGPSGRSAHLEAGFAAGNRARLIVLLAKEEPELMYSMADAICVSLDEVESVVSLLMKSDRLRAAARKANLR